MRRATSSVLVLGLATLLGGCDGGGSGSTPGGDEEARPSETGAAGGSPSPATGVVRDPLLGYELRLPEGWTAPARSQPGAPVPIGGAGEGCAIGTAGTLPAVQDAGDLVAYARTVAVRRAAPGVVVEVESIRGANVPGALARIGRRDAGARSALFASAGGGVAITCTARGAQLASLDRGLPALFRTVRLSRDTQLERLQPALARVSGVTGASLRRQRGTVTARLELERFGAARSALLGALGATARRLPAAKIAISATDPGEPERFALGRLSPGRRQASLQIGPSPPMRVPLRGGG